MLPLMKLATMMEEEGEGEIMRIKSGQTLGPKVPRCLARVQQDESSQDALKNAAVELRHRLSLSPLLLLNLEEELRL